MPRAKTQQLQGQRAAIYARVSDKSQAEEDKTSLSEQAIEMEAYCERKGLTITARYQEIGRGWSKKRPEFQRMLADAKQGLFDTIVCWKSDRLSRGMFPAAALMEVVEAYQIGIEAVMDAIDMKTFGLMAAIGKIELDNFRERSAMGRRGAAKQGRVPTGTLPYGYRTGDDGRPEIDEAEAEVVRRIFRQYVHEGMGAASITWQLIEEEIPMRKPNARWQEARVHRILGNEAYKGAWWFGRARHVATEDGTRVYAQPQETWIKVPVTPLVDEETWDRAQALKKQRLSRSKRNTKVFYLLQHLVRCAECGMLFGGKTNNSNKITRNGKVYRYELDPPQRYYYCYGMQKHRLRCREHPFIRAERLEELVWSEVKNVLQNPGLIVAGIEALDVQEDGGSAEEVARTERDLRRVQSEEDRAIRLYVSGKITENQLDLQRKFITERLESLRAKLDDYRAREASGAQKRALMEGILTWAGEVGEGMDDLTPAQRREVLQMVVDEVVIGRDNNLLLTLGVPLDESVAIALPVPPPQTGEEGKKSRARGWVLQSRYDEQSIVGGAGGLGNGQMSRRGGALGFGWSADAQRRKVREGKRERSKARGRVGQRSGLL